LFPGSSIRINCWNTKIYNKIYNIFSNSFDDGLTLTNNSWDEINFAEYNLIICNSDLMFKLFYYLSVNKVQNVDNVMLFHIGYTELIKLTLGSRLHYKILYNDRRKKVDFTFMFNKVRKNLHREIVILESEIEWANSWLQQNGVKNSDRIILIHHSASSNTKLLADNVYVKLLEYLTVNTNLKILLLDEKGTNKKSELMKVLNSSLINRVIVAEKMSLRKTMCLIASSYIEAIVSPCTGLMHLSNGIYYYLKNNAIIKKVPLLFVYTGYFGDFDAGCHPREWWGNSLVKCLVITKNVDNKKEFKVLHQCPSNIEEYNKIALSVKEITEDLLIDKLSTYI
jgi:hypothetical protein